MKDAPRFVGAWPARPCCDNLSMPQTDRFLETLTAHLYRLAEYATHHLIDDAAMLALIFS